MTGRQWIVSLLVFMPALLQAGEVLPLQAMIDETPENGTLTPPPGTYAGPVVIEFPMTLDGQGQVTIDAGGKGTVVLLDTDGVTLRNLHLTNSGKSHNDIDSGVQVRGNFNVIKDNQIKPYPFKRQSKDKTQKQRS